MRVFRQILHATDFSRASRPALARAIALARQNRAKLSIAHAVSPLVVPLGEGFVSPSTYETIDQERTRPRKEAVGGRRRARQEGRRQDDGRPARRPTTRAGPASSPANARGLDRDRNSRAHRCVQDPPRQRRRAHRPPRPLPGSDGAGSLDHGRTHHAAPEKPDSTGPVGEGRPTARAARHRPAGAPSTEDGDGRGAKGHHVAPAGRGHARALAGREAEVQEAVAGASLRAAALSVLCCDRPSSPAILRLAPSREPDEPV